MTVIERLEKKYGITVVSEGHHFNIYTNRAVETFRVYSADGCCWDKGLTRKGLQAMCKNDHEALLSIKKNEERSLPSRYWEPGCEDATGVLPRDQWIPDTVVLPFE